MKTILPRIFAFVLLTVPVARADWPTYLHDHGRVGATDEALAAPLGGTICVGVPNETPSAVKAKASVNIPAWLAATKLAEEKATIQNDGAWSRLVRGPLPGAGAWSHLYGNAANTSSNTDERIKGGLGVLWYGDPGPGKMINRHDGAVGPLSVNGRLFLQSETSVMAYDAYNGQFLWEKENPGAIRTGAFAAREPGNMAVSGDLVVDLISPSPETDAAHQPLLSGIEVVRTNAQEILKPVATR